MANTCIRATLCIERWKVGRTSHGAWRLYLWGLQSIDPARHSGVVRPAGNFVVGHWNFLSGENSGTNRWNGRWRPSGASQCYVLVYVYIYNIYNIYIYSYRSGPSTRGTQTSNVDTCNWTLRALTILRESRREGGGRKQPSATREIQGEIARVNLYPSLRNKRFSSPFFPKNNLSIKGENSILPPSSKRYFAIYWFNRSPERFARFIVIHFSGYNRRIIRGGQKYSGTLQAE